MNLREWALPVYTILMQLAIGALFSLWVIRTLSGRKYGQEKMDQITIVPVLIIFSTIVLAMVGSHFHLSKPYLSFLAVRNFRYSWLSREVVFTIIVFIFTGFLLLMLRFIKGYHFLKLGLGWGGILAGFATIYCMASIYLLPSQIAWNSFVTILSSFGVMLLLGTTSLMVILLMDLRFSAGEAPQELEIRTQIIKKSSVWLTVVAILATILVIFLGLFQIRLLRTVDLASAQVSLKLLLELYRPLLIIRIVLTIVGVAWLVTVVIYFIRTRVSFMQMLEPVYIACIMVMVGEILERYLFYATHVRIGI
jgi:DMSO reductase anchor subunit